MNKYFTKEFFTLLKARMSNGGVLSIPLPTSMNYMNSQVLDLNSCVVAALKANFNKVLPLPFTQLFLLAGDSVLTPHIAELIEKKRLATMYINSYYIDDSLLTDKIREVQSSLQPHVAPNTVWKPVAYYHTIRLWLDRNKSGYFLLTLGMLLLGAFVMTRRGPYVQGVFMVGFVSAGLEYLIMVGYQLSFGNLAAYSGLLVSFYMNGLFIGSVLPYKRAASRFTWFFGLILGGLAVYFIPLALSITDIFTPHRSLLFIYFSSLLLFTGLYTGRMFNLCMKKNGEIEPAIQGIFYGADLAGSAIGMLAVSLLLFPLAGLRGTGGLVAGLILLTALRELIYPAGRKS